MQDTALYQDLLGLQAPWTVRRVNLDVKGQRVGSAAGAVHAAVRAPGH